MSRSPACGNSSGVCGYTRTFLRRSDTPFLSSACMSPEMSLLLCFSYLRAYSMTSRAMSTSRVLSLESSVRIFYTKKDKKYSIAFKNLKWFTLTRQMLPSDCYSLTNHLSILALFAKGWEAADRCHSVHLSQYVHLE